MKLIKKLKKDIIVRDVFEHMEKETIDTAFEEMHDNEKGIVESDFDECDEITHIIDEQIKSFEV